MKNSNDITFENLQKGDMFNTKIARFVKISDSKAIVVMSGLLDIGTIQKFKNYHVIDEILFSSKYSF